MTVRCECDCVDSVFSDEKRFRHGVAQGSIVGLISFIIIIYYNNELWNFFIFLFTLMLLYSYVTLTK